MAMDNVMISAKEDNRQSHGTRTGTIKCSLCGHVFEKGRNTFCKNCPLSYGNCHFEKCPHCGYDIPQGSYLWTLMGKMIKTFKKARKK